MKLSFTLECKLSDIISTISFRNERAICKILVFTVITNIMHECIYLVLE